MPSDNIADTGISGDGTCQKRRFPSYNGVFAAISTVNGKIIDVEPTSRYCVIKIKSYTRLTEQHMLNVEVLISVDVTMLVQQEDWIPRMQKEYLSVLLINMKFDIVNIVRMEITRAILMSKI